MISLLLNNGDWRRILLLKYPSRCLSIWADAPRSKEQKLLFFRDYLINSLDFSTQEALCAAQKLRLPSKPIKNDPNLVLLFFQKLGLTKTQIKGIVSTSPRLLLSNVDKALQPKIRVLEDLGLSGSDLVRVLTCFKSFLAQGLRSQIRPPVEYVRKLMGSDKNAVRAIRKCTSLLHGSAPSRVAANVLVLERLGFSRENVISFIIRSPRDLLREPHFFEEIAKRAENEYEFSPNSKKFHHLFTHLSCLHKTTIDLKFRTLRSFGLNDATIYSMVRRSPCVLGCSEARLREFMEFFSTELEYGPGYLASHPVLFSLSLEKRVKPRCQVIKILQENNLAKRSNLYRALCVKHSDFEKIFLLPHKDKLPNLYASYIKTVGTREDNR